MDSNKFTKIANFRRLKEIPKSGGIDDVQMDLKHAIYSN